MSFAHRWFAGALLLVVTSSAAYGADHISDANKLWEDFNHYVLVARPDLADAAAKKLLTQSDDNLLGAVESVDSPDNLSPLWARAAGMALLRDSAQALEDKIQSARVAKSREVDRIAVDIDNLGKDRRHYINAVQRLRGAGQFAAPHLLSALLDPARQSSQPFVLRAMVDLGQPMVYPLSEALSKLEPAPQGQIGQVLGEIGYPTALPAIVRVLESSNTDPHARAILQAAKTHILKNVSGSTDLSAAELYFNLGLNQYDSAAFKDEIPGYDDTQDKGIVWAYDVRTGLVPIPVPGKVYGDVLAMRSATTALQLRADFSEALTLWVMANLRRENMLNGDIDPSYGADRRAPMFYAQLAGPQRQQQILARALHDQDAELALDAIEALRRTAGPAALLNHHAASKPLIEALSFPDQRVRYQAAFALTNARPKEAFDGSFRVVPVLSQAVRQSDVRYAIVLADDDSARGSLSATIKELGFQPLIGATLEDLADDIRQAPGIDLILTAVSPQHVMDVHRQTMGDYKLVSTPIVAMTTPAGQIKLTARFAQDRRIRTVVAGPSVSELEPAVQAARRGAGGAEITSQQADAFALTALHLLRDVALTGGGEIYQIADAQPALIAALNDQRDAVAIGAAGVLSLVDDPQAQQAIAPLPIDTTRTMDVRLAALARLAESFNQFGNKLPDSHNALLRELAASSEGDLAESAARAVGAGMPAAHQAVELILE